MNSIEIQLNKRILHLGNTELEISHDLTKWLIKYKNLETKYNLDGFKGNAN